MIETYGFGFFRVEAWPMDLLVRKILETKSMADLSMTELQRMVKKYGVTKSGSRPEVARRLRQVVPHVMTLADLKKVEDFLRIPPAKRWKGQRYYSQHRGLLVVRMSKR